MFRLQGTIAMNDINGAPQTEGGGNPSDGN